MILHTFDQSLTLCERKLGTINFIFSGLYSQKLAAAVLIPIFGSTHYILTGSCSAVGNLYDCLSGSCECDPGPVPYFLGEPNKTKNTYTGTYIIWASSRENLSSVVCEQQRHRPACAYAQSDQRLCCSLIVKYHI